ncbi:hypothetical protein [Streptomyces sp. AP-93]|uniref:hypothetical protein n=1 Tax=Streptomyces sp. AP-93 TaxID=2929048 RepID=UPI001FAFEAF4|nr:hypothetical protein [Streptomyces sp. AP-93]MCJ0874239.1 hypothetical protein [Streptomyces sp. AP-93]
MPTVEYDGPEKQENVTVLSLRVLRWTREKKSILIVVAREGMRVTSQTEGSVTSDPVWERGGGDATGYKQYRHRFNAKQLVNPQSGSVDFGCSATLHLDLHGDVTNLGGPYTKRISRPVTFAAGERTQALVFDEFPDYYGKAIAATLRDPASGASGRVLCGIQGHLEGSSDGGEVKKEVDAPIAKHDPPRPDPLGGRHPLPGMVSGGLASVNPDPKVYRAAALQANNGSHNLL